MAKCWRIGPRSRLSGFCSTCAAGGSPAGGPPPTGWCLAAASWTITALSCSWERSPGPLALDPRWGRLLPRSLDACRLLSRLVGLLHRRFGLRNFLPVHVRRVRKFLDGLPFGGLFHVVSPGQGWIGATEERAVTRAGVIVQIAIPVVARDVHHRRRDLSGVRHEPG